MDKIELIAEAAGKLDAFFKSGIKGFRQQAYDRLRAAGIPTDVLTTEQVREHLRQTWGV